MDHILISFLYKLVQVFHTMLLIKLSGFYGDHALWGLTCGLSSLLISSLARGHHRGSSFVRLTQQRTLRNPNRLKNGERRAISSMSH